MTPFIEPGDEVLVHNPSYPSNFLDPQLLNGVVVKVPTYEEDNYRLRVEEYEKRLTPKTKMVLLSSPNNPTGPGVHPGGADRAVPVHHQA